MSCESGHISHFVFSEQCTWKEKNCRRESQGELTLKPSGNMSYQTCVGEGTSNYILVGHAQVTVRPAGMLIQWA